MGTDWSPVGQIYWYTLQSTNPRYDVMELKSLKDWVLEKQFKSVPNVVDVSSLGGPTKEYQVAIDPEKLHLVWTQHIAVGLDAAARFGINVADVQAAVQTAIGGSPVSQVLQGRAEVRSGCPLSSPVPRYGRRHRPYSSSRAGSHARCGLRRGVGDLPRS